MSRLFHTGTAVHSQAQSIPLDRGPGSVSRCSLEGRHRIQSGHHTGLYSDTGTVCCSLGPSAEHCMHWNSRLLSSHLHTDSGPGRHTFHGHIPWCSVEHICFCFHRILGNTDTSYDSPFSLTADKLFYMLSGVEHICWHSRVQSRAPHKPDRMAEHMTLSQRW